MISGGVHTYIPDDIDSYKEVNLFIGNFCSIGSGLKIYSGTHSPIEFPLVVSQFPFREVWGVDYPPCTLDGKVSIGNDVWIATDVKILAGVTIGDGAIIGANSMVTKDIPPYSLAVGNPAVVKRYRFDTETITKLLTIKWWLWDDEKIKQAIPYMDNVKEFIRIYG
jgi:virginiamycin A acetyltransferase